MKFFYLLLFLGFASNASAITDTPTTTPSGTVTPTITQTPFISATTTSTFAPTPTISQTPTSIAALRNLSAGSSPFIYPDPAKAPDASLAVFMAEVGSMELNVYNLAAEPVLVDLEQLGAGPQRVQFHIDKLPPGVYFYRCKFNYNSGKTEDSKLLKFRVRP